MTQKHRNMIVISALSALVLLLVLTGCGSKDSGKAGSTQTTSDGLKITDTKIGTGAAVKSGDTVTVNYSGWLYVDGKKGMEFDSSTDSSFNHVQPFQTQIGVGTVIKGWDEGIVGMKVGGERTLIIPSDLGYGAQGSGPSIPPNATLLFEVSLVSID